MYIIMLASFPKVPKTSENPENPCFRWSHCRLTPAIQGTPENICMNLILPESKVIGLHLFFIVWVYLHSNFRGVLRNTHMFWKRVCNGPSRSSKVVDFGTNRKRVCDFLLAVNSDLGPILPRFRGIAGFLLRTTPPLFHPNFSGVLFGARLPMLWLPGAKTLS